jgi:hypothetical protein
LTSLSRWLCRVIIVLVPTLALAGILFAKEARAAGAFAIGKCGAYPVCIASSAIAFPGWSHACRFE